MSFEKTKELVFKYIEKAPPGTVIVANDIDGNLEEVVEALHCGVKTFNIEYVCKNIFFKPRYSELLQKYVYAAPSDVVYHIAKVNDWTIIPSELHCLNVLGLSTQVPAQNVFTSTGPICFFNINGLSLHFEHSNERYLTELGGRARLFIHAMASLKGFDTSLEWDRAQKLLSEEDKEELRRHLDCVPTWIIPELKKHIL